MASGEPAAFDQRPLPNTYWVVPGRFLAGEYPGDEDPRKAAAKLNTLLRAGVNHFIDLTTPRDGLEPYVETARSEAGRLGLSIEWERHPVADMSVPSSPEQMSGILRRHRRRDVRRQERSTSTAGAASAARARSWAAGWCGAGAPATRPWPEIAEWWQHVEKADRIPASPQTSEQRDYVRRWTEPPPGR